MTWANISEVVDVNPRISRKLAEKPDQLASFLSMSGLSEDGEILEVTERPIRELLKGYTPFQKGDVLVAKITPCMENGKAGLMNSLPHEFGFGSTEFHVLRPKPSVDPKYLYYMVWNPNFRYVAEISMTGSAGQKRVPTGFFGRYKIPLPPPEEQRRIAAILDKADAIRKKRKKAIELTETFLRSVFLDMFGDPVTNPKGWSVKKLSDFLTFLTSGSRGWAKYYAEDGIAFLRIQNVGKNQLLLDDVAHVAPPDSAEAQRTLVQEDDILLSITADLGRTAVVPKGLGKAHINQHLAILRVAGIEPLYLSAYMASAGGQSQFAKLNRSGVKAGLNFDDIRSVKVLIPPQHLQHRFVELYSRYQLAMGNCEIVEGETENLFNALVQRAFRGEL